MKNEKNIIAALTGDLGKYSSIPFWSWNNELEIPELIRQMSEFKELGIDAFFMHARTGLKTKYLGEKWFDCVSACLDEARRLNMKAWIYDENGWPSGFAEGKLLDNEDNLVRYLEYANGKVTVKSSRSFADILNPDVVSQFIEATHEEYYKRFRKSFGKELAGFFTDEPQYYRWGVPYSRILPKEYAKAYGGEDILPSLKHLFEEGEEAKIFRYKYYSLLGSLYTDNFYKRIYDWCESHGCLFTGHSVEENSLHGQMWCCAGVMPSYEYQHIPGIDWLGRNIGNLIGPKQAGSAAQQLGKKQVVTETFGCSGWDATPRELRRIAEFQYAGGVNTICQHLCSYSLKGHAKSDYPPSFTRHNTWIKDSKPFNDYFKRLSYMFCNTCECADTLVIHPISSAYLTYQRFADYKSIQQLEDDFSALTEMLTARGVQFHYGDERIMTKNARLDGKELVVGECRYTRVILPAMENIRESTLQLLHDFEAAGGDLCFFGEAPKKADGVPNSVNLSPKIKFEDVGGLFAGNIEKTQPLIVSHRKGAIGEFMYVFNSSADKSAAIIPSCGYKILDLISLSLTDGNGAVTIPPMESVILLADDMCTLALSDIKEENFEDITDTFRMISATDNNLTIDFVSISKDGINFETPEYIHSVNERLIKESYNGKLWLKYDFEVKDIPSSSKILAEQMSYISARLNGNDIHFEQSGWDTYFCECDISPHIKKGPNSLTTCIKYFQKPAVKNVLYDPDVMESLKNCAVVDTEIESIYIQGGFAVSNDRVITKSAAAVSADNLQLNGYPNFGGKISFAGEVSIDSPNVRLQLSGRYMTAAVKVNGKDAGVMMMSESLCLSDAVKKGKNKIEITLTASMRNMLGPHHFIHELDPFGVNPYHFNFRGTWKDGAAPDFTPEYRLVKFGLDKILLTEI